jgi:succinate dehydrogenase / fumarate reductase membrane anchor subunit
MSSIRTPLRRVIHLGSAHGGTDHFWRQRLTAAANVPLVIGFIVLVAMTAGRPHPDAVAILGSPLAALILILMVLSVTVHMRLGMQVIIEDYVRGEALKVVLLLANTLFCVVVGVAAVFAVVTLAMAG